ncbi:MAG: aspartate aminotransferase family protein [Minisyncoccia bacterium]
MKKDNNKRKTTNSKKIFATDKNVFFAVPYRKMILKSGKGMWVKDVDNNLYLDMMSGQFCLPLGYSDAAVAKLIKRQLATLVHTNTMFLTEDVVRGARALASVVGKAPVKVFFLSTGAEAVEFAIRNAKAYSSKESLASLSVGYHGLTLATQALSNFGLYAKPMIPKTYHLPVPDWVNRPKSQTAEQFTKSCLKETEEVLRGAKGDLASIIVEPVISVGGMIFPQKEYFIGLAKIAKSHKALLIFDESQTGIGRTGTWFAYEHYGVVPDMIILAKGIGLGFATSAVVMKADIAKVLEGIVLHFSSHQNDPLSGATTDFLISYIKKQKMLRSITERGTYFLGKLRAIAEHHPIIVNPRGLGLMLGFDLDEKYFTNERNPGQELVSLLEKEGVLIQAVRRGKTFRILPAYIIKEKEIDIFIKKLDSCLKMLEKQL